MQLEHHRIADLFREGGGLVLRGRGKRLDGGNPIGGEQPLRLERGKQHPAPPARGANDFVDARVGGRVALPVVEQGRRFIQRLQLGTVAPHVRKRPRGPVGVLERRDSRVIQDRLAGLDRRPTHPAREQRLFALEPGQRLQSRGHRRGVGDGLRVRIASTRRNRIAARGRHRRESPASASRQSTDCRAPVRRQRH